DRPTGAIALRVPKSSVEAARAGPEATTILQKPGIPQKPSILQKPGISQKPGAGGTTAALGSPKASPKAPPRDVLSVDVIDYDDAGRVRIGGAARPGARVRIYLENTPLGDTIADGRGRWSFRPDNPLKPGTYKLRVDELRAGGQVARRIEIPFRRAVAITRLPAGGIAVVQPGNTLWRIARDTYGHGIQYTVIYGANKDQIRDPDLIYPGQIFSLPRPEAVN
ncbi:MAG: LysM peptidoglycan-binding domain-containing protein, partial [Alphaproteobacteria bacterium]|nr:LysM peptidoglycan-binding domain-containing protein [Alphaproteobacteria bacterium]